MNCLICICITHLHTEAKPPTCAPPSLPHQKHRLFLFPQGTIIICGKNRRGVWAGRVSTLRQSLLSAGTSTSRAPCDLTARGLQPAPLHRWGLTYGRGKRYSVYSAPAILNVLFNNLSREEALLLIFNTKCACRFATVSCLKVLLAAHTQIVIFPLMATCLSTWSHNSWGITKSSKLDFLFCFMDCLRPFPPLSPAFFFYF